MKWVFGNPLSLTGEDRCDGNENIIIAVAPVTSAPQKLKLCWADARKAKEKLGWPPKTTFKKLVAEMAFADLREAKRDKRSKNIPCSVSASQT